MLFEVVNQLGNTVMSTQWETCVYDQDDLTSLHKAGYRFKVDGKFVNLGKVVARIHESVVSNPEPPAPIPSDRDKPEVTENAIPMSTAPASEEVAENSVETVDDCRSVVDDSAMPITGGKIDQMEEAVSVPKVAEDDAQAPTAAPSLVQSAAKKKTVIRCKETGQIWDKQSHAAKELGIDAAQVSDSIKTGKTRSGYTFERIEVDG